MTWLALQNQGVDVDGSDDIFQSRFLNLSQSGQEFQTLFLIFCEADAGTQGIRQVCPSLSSAVQTIQAFMGIRQFRGDFKDFRDHSNGLFHIPNLQ